MGKVVAICRENPVSGLAILGMVAGAQETAVCAKFRGGKLFKPFRKKVYEDERGHLYIKTAGKKWRLDDFTRGRNPWEENALYSYECSQYTKEPIYFSQLSLSEKEIHDCIYYFEMWYSELAVDPEKYAFEFLILVRHLLLGLVPVNLLHLDMEMHKKTLLSLFPRVQRKKYEEDEAFHKSFEKEIS